MKKIKEKQIRHTLILNTHVESSNVIPYLNSPDNFYTLIKWLRSDALAVAATTAGAAEHIEYLYSLVVGYIKIEIDNDNIIN